MANIIKRALIVGGGIGGLCAAIALRRVGVESVVYEQSPGFDRAGAGLVLWPNAIKALRQLGLVDAVIKAGARIEALEIRHSSGKILSRWQLDGFERRFGAPAVPIHRAALHEILLAALPSEVLVAGARCIDLVEHPDGAAAVFANGQTAGANLIVGADGIHSLLRQRLFPKTGLRYAGYTAWRGVVATQKESLPARTCETWGQSMRFGVVRIDKERVYWFATANGPAGETQTGAERREFLRRRFRNWHEPIRSLIDSTPAGEILRNDIFDLKPLDRWGTDRLILLGDAAHATTPNMGQGACMAIESSIALARCLSEEESLAIALRRYEMKRMARTAWVTRRSRRIGRVGQAESPLTCCLRDCVVRLTPSAAVEKMLEKVFNYQS